jgi:hypothetical protein
MQGGQFPASAANSLIQGYCEDFVSFAAVLAQTLEQVSMRGIDLKQSRTDLERIENGMRNLADAIHELLARQPAKGGAKPTERAPEKAPPVASANPAPKAAAPAPSAPAAPAARSQPAPSPTPVVAPTPAANARAAAPTNQGAVRVDMRPRDEEPTSKPTTPAPKPNASADATTAPKPAPAAASDAAPTPTATANTGTPPATPVLTPAPPATAPGRPVGTAPANRAKAAAPGSTPRPTTAANAARPGQRPAARPENLKGTNRSMPLLSVMQFLGRMRKRGTMKVALPGETLTFDIENGCVMSAASTNCPRDERLGDILCDMDVCTREQLEPLELLVESGQAAERFGQLVLEHQLANDQQVVAALEAQVKTRFSRACKHLEASYEFVEGERTSAPPAFPVQPLPIA